MNLRVICALITSTLLLTSCSFNADDKQLPYQFKESTVLDNLDSVEYKILLNPGLLQNTSGFKTIWDILKQTASQQGITVEPEKKPYRLSYRNIRYLDTGNLDLREKGYALRYRQKFKKYSKHGNDDNRIGKKYDITLKYRNRDKAASLATKLSVNMERFGKVANQSELEADVTIGGIIFSHAVTLKLNEGKHGSFADLFDDSITGQKGYATMFPELAEFDMISQAIIPVADMTIVEAKAEPGQLVFLSDVKPYVAISLFNNSDGASIAAEVSFDFNIAGKNHTVTFEELKQIEAFYSALVKNLGEMVFDGTTKTASVYTIGE